MKSSLDCQFGRKSDKGVDQRVEALDLAEAGLGEVEVGEVAAMQSCQGGGKGEGREVW